MAISFSQRMVVPHDTLVNVVGGESVILKLKDESYFGLDAVATDMWRALTSSNSIQSAYESLLVQYDVNGEKLKDDLVLFVENLMAHELVELI